jgi:hypothetical protein
MTDAKGNAAGSQPTGGERHAPPGGPTKTIPAESILPPLSVTVNSHDREVCEWAMGYWPDIFWTWHQYRDYYERQWLKSHRQTTLEGA